MLINCNYNLTNQIGDLYVSIPGEDIWYNFPLLQQLAVSLWYFGIGQ